MTTTAKRVVCDALLEAVRVTGTLATVERQRSVFEGLPAFSDDDVGPMGFFCAVLRNESATRVPLLAMSTSGPLGRLYQGSLRGTRDGLLVAATTIAPPAFFSAEATALLTAAIPAGGAAIGFAAQHHESMGRPVLEDEVLFHHPSEGTFLVHAERGVTRVADTFAEFVRDEVARIVAAKDASGVEALDWTSPTDDDLARLSRHAASVTTVYLSGQIPRPAVEALATLPNLREIELDASACEPDTVGALVRLATLSSVRIAHADPTVFDDLRALSHAVSLEVSGVETDTTRRLQKDWQQLRIRTFELAGGKLVVGDLTSEALTCITSLPGLTELKLYETRIDAATLRHVHAHSPGLQTFRLSGGEVSDDVPEALALFSELRVVDLFVVRISPETEKQIIDADSEERSVSIHALRPKKPKPKKKRSLPKLHRLADAPSAGDSAAAWEILWRTLVPASGACRSLQGELVRSLGRLEREYSANALGNYYAKDELDPEQMDLDDDALFESTDYGRMTLLLLDALSEYAPRAKDRTLFKGMRKRVVANWVAPEESKGIDWEELFERGLPAVIDLCIANPDLLDAKGRPVNERGVKDLRSVLPPA